MLLKFLYCQHLGNLFRRHTKLIQAFFNNFHRLYIYNNNKKYVFFFGLLSLISTKYMKIHQKGKAT